MLLIVIMGGRVIPFFTERALPGVVMKRWSTIEWLSPLSVMLFLLVDFLFADSLLSAALPSLPLAPTAFDSPAGTPTAIGAFLYFGYCISAMAGLSRDFS